MRLGVVQSLPVEGRAGLGERQQRHDPREVPVAGVAERDGAVVVELAGELDLYNAQDVREALIAQAERDPPRLVVDLSRVTFIDSTGIGVLIEARTRLGNRQGFLVVSPGLETRRALEISGLIRLFSVHDTLEQALAATV